jgi:superfamily II DNA or RNA helicase
MRDPSQYPTPGAGAPSWRAEFDDARIPTAGESFARLLHPCIRVWHEALFVDRGDAMRTDDCEIRAPVIALSFQYDGFRVPAAEPSPRVFCAREGRRGSASATPQLRDLAAEAQARIVLESFGAIELALLEDYAAAPDCRADYTVHPEGDAQTHCAFVAHALPQLRAQGWEVELEAAYPYRVVTEPTWYSDVAPAGEKPDWFGLELGVEIKGHRIDLLPVLLSMLEDGGERVDLLRLEHRGPRFVRVEGQGCYVEVPSDVFRTLARVLAELYQGSTVSTETLNFPGMRATSVLELDEVFARAGQTLNSSCDPQLRERFERLSSPPVASELPAQATVSGLRATLRPYQAEGVAWLQRLAEHGAGALLADDMGLGKTLQVIAFLCARIASGRALAAASLVVAPTSLIANWRRELERFAPHLQTLAWVGARRHEVRGGLTDSDIVLVSYGVLLRDFEALAQTRFDCLILDEAQAIKNPRSRAAELVKGLQCEQRIALSGTPIENNLQELWSLMDFAVPGLLGSEAQFKQFFRTPIEQQHDEHRLLALRSQVAPYLLRRMKEQVARELPPKTEVVRPVELKGKQRELYESIRIAAHEKIRGAMRQRGVGGSTVTILAALTKLRQLCCDPRLLQGEHARGVRDSAKYQHLMELLRDQNAQGRKVLVFSQFASMLALIAQGLRDARIDHVALTGQTRDRERPVRAFQEGDASVFLISLKAGGTGLNLTRADTVVHYDPWWNPAAQDQATDRAHRIGQRNPVFVYSLIAAGSVEERMLALQQHKRRLASAVVAAPSEGGPSFTEAEVERLFAPLSDND